MNKLLLIPDVHRPYHSKLNWYGMLKAAQIFKPKKIVTLGDFGDFAPVSSHDKNLKRLLTLDEEIIDQNEALTELQSLGASEHVFIEGNHEDRLSRYLMVKAPELFGMVRVQDLLKLKERNWKFVPYKQHHVIGKLHITHDTGKAGKYAHYQAMDAFQANVVIGHTHRLGYAVVGNAKGKAHVGAMLGWLGDVNRIDYMHRINALRDWASGFGIGYEMSDGSVHVQPIPIVNNRVIVEGREVKFGT